MGRIKFPIGVSPYFNKNLSSSDWPPTIKLSATFDVDCKDIVATRLMVSQSRYKAEFSGGIQVGGLFISGFIGGMVKGEVTVEGGVDWSIESGLNPDITGKASVIIGAEGGIDATILRARVYGGAEFEGGIQYKAPFSLDWSLSGSGVVGVDVQYRKYAFWGSWEDIYNAKFNFGEFLNRKGTIDGGQIVKSGFDAAIAAIEAGHGELRNKAEFHRAWAF